MPSGDRAAVFAVVILAVMVWISPKLRGGDVAKRRRRSGLSDPAWQQGGIALIAVGAFLIGAISATEAQRKVGQPRGVWETRGLWAGFIIAGLGVVLIFISLYTAWRRWLDDRKTPFDMIYDENDSECDFWFDENARQLRVRVTNNGPVGVTRVRVHMTPEHGHQHFLHIRHDNEPLHRLSRDGEYLTVGQNEYFDLGAVSHGVWWLYYADEAIAQGSRTSVPGTLRLRLVASGWRDSRDVVPLAKDFDLTYGPGMAMSLAEVTQ